MCRLQFTNVSWDMDRILQYILFQYTDELKLHSVNTPEHALQNVGGVGQFDLHEIQHVHPVKRSDGILIEGLN